MINIFSDHASAVKIFYELKDFMMLLPVKCKNSLNLKQCFILRTNQLVLYMSNKYLLKKSVGGYGMVDVLSDFFRYMYSKTNNLVWSNFSLMKNYFY